MLDADRADWNAAMDELDRELDDLDAELAIAEAEFEADRASDKASVARAVQRQLDAYTQWFDRRQAQSNEFQRSSSAASSALRDGVREAMNDLGPARTAAMRAFWGASLICYRLPGPECRISWVSAFEAQP